MALNSRADTYLLRSGDATSGTVLHENDDHEGSTSASQIQETLAAGSYTVEATTYSVGATGAFTLSISGLAGTAAPDPGTGTGDNCAQAIAADGTVSGSWASGCDSEARTGSHARYYSFTLEQSSEVTVALNSSAADTYLYLRSGDATSGTVLHENDDHEGSTSASQIQETLAAGSYTVEATTYSAGATGAFTLSISGLAGTAAPDPGTGTGDNCSQAIAADGTVSGSWASGCDSEERTGSHARYYSFTLEQSSEVTVVLNSSAADTYLYLRSGDATSGTVLHENDDHEGSTSASQIQETLAAGSYTVEATTYSAGATGAFTLSISGLAGTAAPDPGTGTGDNCSQAIAADGTVSGSWASGCDSEARTGSHARYYSFTLEQSSEVTVALNSSAADTYLYLRSGDATSGTALHENDDHEGSTSASQIQETLAAGSYTVEATTYSAGATGAFTLSISGLAGTAAPDPGTGTGDNCSQAIAADGTVSGSWASGCDSEARTGSHARYYSFTLEQSSEVTVALNSSAADTYLYLRSGDATSGTVLHENDDHEGSTSASQIQETLAAGSYTVEATTYSAGATGAFTLSISGLAGTTAPDPGTGTGDNCSQTIAADGTVSGSWASGCDSEERTGSHARYYSFTLEQSSEVTVALNSSAADTYLYLRNGDATSGTVLHENDDHEGSTSASQIQETLAAGSYTVEATTYSAGATGAFTLSISGLAGTAAPDPGTGTGDNCSQTIAADGTVSGSWASGCDSEERTGSHARYYSFTLEQSSEVTVALNSSAADTYLYLRSGDATSGTALHENDDHEGSTSASQIQETLAAGSYTVEATTYSAGATGAFTLSISGLAGTAAPDPGTGTGDNCAQAIAADGTVSGSWASGCDSEERTGSHARYYSFTLEQSSEVTVALNSSAADTFLYLRNGDATSGTALHENDDHEGSTSASQIQETLAAGSYTVEATTYSVGATGAFTLSISGLAGTAAPDPGTGTGDNCSQAIAADGTVSGSWASGCDSEERTGSHARYYSFTLEQSSEVTVALNSSAADTYLYLRNGDATSGTVLHENDDHEGSTSASQIQETLAAGSYTVEATTYSAGATGAFTLSISGLAGTTAPDPGTGTGDNCSQTIAADGTVSGSWASGCDSEERTGSHARYYSFTLEQSSEVTVALNSSAADTYLYLRSGDATSGTALHENDDHEGSTSASQIQETLAAGSYTVEATTYSAGATGAFTLSISGLAGTAGPGPGPGTGTGPGSIESDRAALVVLYNTAGGANWADNSGWASDAPLGEWFGIETDDNGRVVRVDLQENSLSGAIPRDLGNLTSLKWLFLNNLVIFCQDSCTATSPTANRLTGTIPPELGQLTNLESLYLTDNPLTGEIPAELAGLVRLKRLSLAGGQLSGEIPSSLGDLANLDMLILDWNKFSGPIPVELGNLTKLTHLKLSVNQLTGTIPASLGNLTRLEHLGLYKNQLTGSIPASLGNLSNLNDMYISENELSGCIPAGLKRVPGNDFFELPFCSQ